MGIFDLIMSAIQKVDVEIINFIDGNLHFKILDMTIPSISALGNLGLIWILVVIIILMNKNYRKTGILILAALILSLTLGEGIIKHQVERPRPFENSPTLKILSEKPITSSFPSGHTAASFSVFGIVFRRLKRYKYLVLVLAILIALSRMYLNVHYPSDVFCGGILGVLSSAIVLYIDNKIIKKIRFAHDFP